jgi:diguanylate cyclase (GGDEF)-like protein
VAAQLHEAEEELGRARESLGKERRRADMREAEARQERELRKRIDRARRAEREWARELREQLSRLHREHGTLDRGNDVPSMLLHLARTLMEADKALLLARSDEDGDGALDLRAHEGFEHDPSGSAVAERFAREVLERDTIIREDEPDRVNVDGATPADDEIENLAAVPIFIHDAFSGVVVGANRKGGFVDLDDDVLLSVGDHAGAVLENTKLHGALRKAYVATVQMFADAIESKDPSASAEHEALSDFVVALGSRLGLAPSSREALVFAWLLHDVGKLGISERILFKPGPLTPEERRTVDLHCQIGARLVERVPALASVAPAIRHHHEHFDGTGHPSGLSRESIPLEARIISVVDAFGAMTAERPYRDPVSPMEALAELTRCAGTQFDPQVVAAFEAEVRRRGLSRTSLRRRPQTDVESRRDRDEPLLGHGPVGLTDNLTLLYSHRYLHETVEAQVRRAVATGTPFSVLFVDIANLPAINAREGYAAGDRALVATARAIERVASPKDGIACRYSGRRVGVVFPECDLTTLTPLVSQVAAALGGSDLEVGVGGASWQPGETTRDVVSRALVATRAAA